MLRILVPGQKLVYEAFIRYEEVYSEPASHFSEIPRQTPAIPGNSFRFGSRHQKGMMSEGIQDVCVGSVASRVLPSWPMATAPTKTECFSPEGHLWSSWPSKGRLDNISDTYKCDVLQISQRYSTYHINQNEHKHCPRPFHSDHTTMTADTSFQLLTALPPELVERVFERYCDGKALSNLLVVFTSSIDCREAWSERLARIVEHKLLQLAHTIEAHTSVTPGATAAATWIRNLAATPVHKHLWMEILSENLAVVDFLQHSLRCYSNLDHGQLEWPVWIGRITVDSYSTGTRLRHSARVVLTSSMDRPCYMPGGNLMRHQRPSGSFQCEPYRLRAVPPWGQVRPMSARDARTLQPVSRRLSELGQVAVPRILHHFSDHDLLDIRILTKAQARRLANTDWQPKTAWMTQGEDDALLCCWHDDAPELANDRDYIRYILDICRVQRRMEQEAEAEEGVTYTPQA